MTFFAGLLLGGLVGAAVLSWCAINGQNDRAREAMARHVAKARRKQRAARFDRKLSSTALRCMIREAATRIADARVADLLTKGRV